MRLLGSCAFLHSAICYLRSNSNLFTSKSVLSTMSGKSIVELTLNNRNVIGLPVDSEIRNACRTTPNVIFSRVKPTPVDRPQVVAYSLSALQLLGLESVPNETDLAQYLSGNKLLKGSDPVAHCYCGHQFGSFAGQLGDGAAILLGDAKGWELQLKGAGPTPYSRRADGRKVLRSSLREFLCSEHINALNIATTRAGSVVTSSSTVDRDPFYSGAVIAEPCAIVSRISPHFFRFGSFEIFIERGPAHGNGVLRDKLLHHIVSLHYPQLLDTSTDASSSVLSADTTQAFYLQVSRLTAKLVAQWQAVGFVHGVLNTDNLSLQGLTIDYGPYGFLEYYDEDFTPNGSDHSARYSYAAQPSICRWDLKKLGEAIGASLLGPSNLSKVSNSSPEVVAVINGVLENYDKDLAVFQDSLWRRKLGLVTADDIMDPKHVARTIDTNDLELTDLLLQTMKETQIDFTDCFVAITEFVESVSEVGIETALPFLVDKFVSRCASPENLQRLQRRKQRIHRPSLPPQQVVQLSKLLQQDPMRLLALFPGADLESLTAEIEGEQRKVDLYSGSQLLQSCMSLTAEAKTARDSEKWLHWSTLYAQRIQQLGDLTIRARLMRAENPTVVLRNWMAQHAIEAASKGDFLPTRDLLTLLQRPFDASLSSFRQGSHAFGDYQDSNEGGVGGGSTFLSKAPQWADELICTCSS